VQGVQVNHHAPVPSRPTPVHHLTALTAAPAATAAEEHAQDDANSQYDRHGPEYAKGLDDVRAQLLLEAGGVDEEGVDL